MCGRAFPTIPTIGAEHWLPGSLNVSNERMDETKERGMKMRVCHLVSGDLWAGAEAQVATLLPRLAEHSSLEVSAVLFNEGRLSKELRAWEIPVKVLDEKRYSFFRIVAKLIDYFKESPVEIVHVHGYKESVLGIPVARWSGIPYTVQTIHGLREPFCGFDELKMRLYATLNRLVASRYTDVLIGVSGEIARALNQEGYGRSRVVCIHNGIDRDRIVPRQSRESKRRELGLTADALVIGTVGRLVPIKGMEFLVEAASRIQQTIPGARFLIIGNGPLYGTLKKMADDLCLSNVLAFLGDRDDVYDLVNAMDIFVLPSLHEGIPMALLEAMVLAKAIIATDVGGIPEIITHNENGCLIPAGSSEVIASACVALADQNRILELGSAAAKAARDKFDIVETAKSYFNLYSDLLGTR